MAIPPELLDTISLPTQEVLLAATNHSIPTLRTLLRSNNHLVNAQDTETGFSPLHAAVAACEDEDEDQDQDQNQDQDQDQDHNQNHNQNQDQNQDQNGEPSINSHPNGTEEIHNVDDIDPAAPTMESASTAEKGKATVQWLLQHGASWDLLDGNGETPGCIAYRLGLEGIYRVLVDAGTRAEMMMGRRGEYERLVDEHDEDEGWRANGNRDEDGEGGIDAPVNSVDEGPAQGTDHAEFGLGGLSLRTSSLTFHATELPDKESNGVVPSWKREIMQKSADLLLPTSTSNRRVLSIGHGTGTINAIFQSKQPSTHHIIEARPEVLAQMHKDGWHERHGARVHAGRWQDVVPKLIEAGEQFDVVFCDTFAEDYGTFKTLFEEHLSELLVDDGRWSCWNGWGADRQIAYDVYKNVLSMDLQECGYEIAWTELDISGLAGTGMEHGTERRHWTPKSYHLPICSFFS